MKKLSNICLCQQRSIIRRTRSYRVFMSASCGVMFIATSTPIHKIDYLHVRYEKMLTNHQILHIKVRNIVSKYLLLFFFFSSLPSSRFNQLISCIFSQVEYLCISTPSSESQDSADIVTCYVCHPPLIL